MYEAKYKARKRLPARAGSLVTALVLALVLLVAGCDTPTSPDEETPATTDSDVATILSKVVGSIGTTAQFPDTLSSGTGTSASSRAVTNVDYANLAETDSSAYRDLQFHAQAMEGRISGVLDELAILEEQFNSVDLQEDEVWTETLESGETLRLKYTSTEIDGSLWYQITAGTFDAADALTGGTYIEVTEGAGTEVSGQCMYTGTDAEGTFSSKLVFDTTVTKLEEFYKSEPTDPANNETGRIVFIPDPDIAAETAADLFMRWEGPYGTSTQVAWATDTFGGLLEHSDPDPQTAADERLREEQFYIDGTDAKIILRQDGTKTPTYLFERVYRGREKADTPSDTFWDGAHNAYSTAYTPPAGGPSTPESLWVEYDAVADPPTNFDVYASDPTADSSLTPIQSVDSKNPEGLGEIYWLEGSGTDLVSGDAVYYLLNWESAGTTATAEYYKAAEVPPTADLFGDTGFYVQELVPLKYVTGTFGSGNTIIKVDENAIDLGGGEYEDAYFVDTNDDSTWGDWSQVANSEAPDVMLMMCLPEDESYYDEMAQTTVTLPGIPWIMGGVPDNVPLPDGVSLEYTYESQSNEIFTYFGETAASNYLSTTTAEDFPVLQAAWKTISLSDFQ